MRRHATAEVLERRRPAILEAFLERLYATTVPIEVDRERALDSASDLIAEVVASLRAHGRGSEPLARDATFSPAAESHGVQRFEMGYDLAAVIREYGVLTDLMLGAVEDELGESGDDRAIVAYVVGAIARAAEHYARARDADVEARTARHIGFLAHELRNPLGSARLGLTLAQQAGDLRPGRVAGAIERALARLQQLIDGALVEVRVREGALLDVSRIAIRELVGEIGEDASSEAGAKGLELRLEIAGEPAVVGDPRLLRSAIGNLVHNAVKFSHRGGAIVVRARATTGRVLIEVEDACGGLPPGAVDRLFDPFVQRGADRSGFGLGLAIADQAVKAHQGSLRVHDLPGRGCVFVLDLPEAPTA